jgi:uncharacterized membrane protein YkoI
MKTIKFATLLAAMLTLGGATVASAQKAESQAALKKEAKIAEAEARKTALAAVPNGKVQSHELEREKGKLIYSYDIKVAGKSGIEEVNVDAMTGAIVAQQHEDAKAEAKEKKAEAKEKAAAKAKKP